MSKTTMSDFVRDAVREKAARELGALTQREQAFGGVARARDALFKVASDLAQASAAAPSVTADAAVASRMKKLRKLVDDAHVLATELGDALGTDAQREALASQKQAIHDALRAAGVDPASVEPPAVTG